jgi:HEAT repeat protein
MNLSCLLGAHKWDGCTCRTCRKVRDKEHDWSKNWKKCARCGKDGAEDAVKTLVSKLGVLDLSGQIEISMSLVRIGKPAIVPLRLVLSSSDHKARLAAAMALGGLGDLRALEPLIEMLAEENIYIRAAVTTALGRIGAPAVEPLIEKLSDNNWLIRCAAADALAEIKDLRIVDPLVRTLNDTNRFVRHSVVMALCKVGTPAVQSLLANFGRGMGLFGLDLRIEALGKLRGCAVDFLLTKTEDTDENMRTAAVHGLSVFGDSRTVEPLIARLSDNCQYVREYAAKGLGETRDTRAVIPLIDKLGYEHKNVRKAAAAALGKIGDARAVEPLLVRAINNNENWEVAQEFSLALGNIGAPAVEPLKEKLKQSAACGRRAAAEALGRTRDVRVVERLLEVLKDEDCDVRGTTAYALGRIGDSRAVAPLIGCLNDANGDVRQAAAYALGNIGDRSAVEPLMARLDNTDNGLGEAIAYALGKIGDDRAGSFLITMLVHENGALRRAAAHALGEIRDGRAVTPLIVKLSDSNEYVRGDAAVALGKTKDPGAVSSLIARLGDESGYVRERAALALGELNDTRAVHPLKTLLADPQLEARFLFADKIRASAAGAISRILTGGNRPKIEALNTTVIFAVDDGTLFNEIIYIRGTGRGLSWDRGVPMERTTNYWFWHGSKERWVWHTAGTGAPFAYKLLLNDKIPAIGDIYSARVGEENEVAPKFRVL